MASILFGASMVAARVIADDIDLLLLAFIRHLIATLCLAPTVLLWVSERLAWRDLAAVAGLDILCFGLFPRFFSAGLQYIPSTRAALWLATMPFLTFLLAAAWPSGPHCATGRRGRHTGARSGPACRPLIIPLP